MPDLRFVLDRSRRGMAGVALAVAAVALAACGSSSSSTTAPASAGSAAGAGGSAATFSSSSNALGTLLVDASGMTLYHFDKEANGKIACTGGCTTTWPPEVVTGQPAAGPGLTGTLGTVKRPDTGTQLTYNGMPMYRFSGDQKAGDTNGNGIGGVWHVTKVGAASAGSGSTSGSPTTAASSSGYGY
jgi:predicted lipoprotein with Yx(FWY)xxD motif